MELPLEFAEVLDAAERFSRLDQEKLVAILQRRHLEIDRQALEDQVAQVRREFTAGQYRLVPIPQLVFEGASFVNFDKYIAATQYSLPQRLIIRTQAFADDLSRFWDGPCSDVRLRSFELPDTLDQLAADAIQPTLPTRRLQGRLSGCHVWSPEPSLDILFDHVQQDRHQAILLLTIRRPASWLY